MALAQLDGERALEVFGEMSNIVVDINERTKSFREKADEVYESTNMPFVSRIADIVAEMQKNLETTKDSTETLLSELRKYSDMVAAISEGQDV